MRAKQTQKNPTYWKFPLKKIKWEENIKYLNIR